MHEHRYTRIMQYCAYMSTHVYINTTTFLATFSIDDSIGDGGCLNKTMIIRYLVYKKHYFASFCVIYIYCESLQLYSHFCILISGVAVTLILFHQLSSSFMSAGTSCIHFFFGLLICRLQYNILLGHIVSSICFMRAYHLSRFAPFVFNTFVAIFILFLY